MWNVWLWFIAFVLHFLLALFHIWDSKRDTRLMGLKSSSNELKSETQT